MEPNSPKKIQFAVPLFQSQLDPEASEQIRKRRPTPASLVILNENTPPVDDQRTNSTNEEAKEAECIHSTGHERYCSAVKQIKKQNDSSFPEEEEDGEDEEEVCDH
ncbi:protein phosphatase 1 regulatory subunit 1C isoform X4 [Xenopus laevis]|uniref:Protein phosphatase 1 regulatory subunit 1C isoform X4 n=1 Tax=Xenopus laevis TaxID=8355 RepID=A0A8J1M1B5_XENLA|nr:protein phosphatase 1 regulatory subunit 1C isoform X4 [Xenopus laevis]